MFFASSSIEVGPSRMDLWLGVGRNARVYAAQRSGLAADTQLLPAARCSARAVSVLWILLEGEATFEHEGRVTRMQAPSVAIIPESWREGANGERLVRIRMGVDCASVQVLFRAATDTIQPLHMPPQQLAEVAALHREIMGASEEHGFALLRALLRRLVTFGLVPPTVFDDDRDGMYTSPTFARVWRSMRRRIAAFDVNPSIKTIAAEAELSSRHAHRIANVLFDECLMPPGGFRGAMVNLRLTLASILLSKSSLQVLDIARIVGYQNPETLTRALRHTGLPAPLEIRRSHSSAPAAFA